MAVDPAKLNWTRSGEIGVGTRALVWVALVLGHVLFLWAPLWDGGKGPLPALGLASDSLAVLTVALWAPAVRPLSATRCCPRRSRWRSGSGPGSGACDAGSTPRGSVGLPVVGPSR